MRQWRRDAVGTLRVALISSNLTCTILFRLWQNKNQNAFILTGQNIIAKQKNVLFWSCPKQKTQNRAGQLLTVVRKSRTAHCKRGCVLYGASCTIIVCNWSLSLLKNWSFVSSSRSKLTQSDYSTSPVAETQRQLILWHRRGYYCLAKKCSSAPSPCRL